MGARTRGSLDASLFFKIIFVFLSFVRSLSSPSMARSLVPEATLDTLSTIAGCEWIEVSLIPSDSKQGSSSHSYRKGINQLCMGSFRCSANPIYSFNCQASALDEATAVVSRFSVVNQILAGWECTRYNKR